MVRIGSAKLGLVDLPGSALIHAIRSVRVLFAVSFCLVSPIIASNTYGHSVTVRVHSVRFSVHSRPIKIVPIVNFIWRIYSIILRGKDPAHIPPSPLLATTDSRLALNLSI